MKRIHLALATGLGLGFLPAPGTFGSLWGILFVVYCHRFSPVLYGITLLALIALAIHVSNSAEEDYGHDASRIVIDEVVGMIITLSFVPLTLTSLGLGFVLFRLLDIFKPYPIRWFEKRFAGGLGIVLDDVVAGFFANLILRVILLLIAL